MHENSSGADPRAVALAGRIRRLGLDAGFDAIGFSHARHDEATRQQLAGWLAAGYHGQMDYMARHEALRADPAKLVRGVRTVISVRRGYLPELPEGTDPDPLRATVSRYAMGRDYHKLMRNRLQQLATEIAAAIGQFGYRVFVDSAPVLEVEFARRAGLGWRGKHSLLLDRSGSWNFIGEIFTDLELPADAASTEHCGNCRACIDACPTRAIVAPYRVDARRCISYLTIELKGSIPEPLRPLIGNRIYGCDDCQLACPWNRFARHSPEPDFAPRQGLDRARLTELFAWTPTEFADRLAGSAIRRIGHERWLRNIAVALGNASPDPVALSALKTRADDPSPLVREHVAWALARHTRPG